MINFANTTTLVADNKVSFCGIEYLITDKEAEQLKSILDGMVSNRGIGNVSQTVNTSSTSQTVTTKTTEEKTPYVAKKDFAPKFKITEQISTDGTKLFCISRDNGWTKTEKNLMNKSIKALKNITEIEVEGDFKKKDGTTYKGTFKAWGYKTKATAEKYLKELPTVFTVAQLNGEV